MSRSKYINTFNTTTEYNNYIESGYPEFPNVGYDKEAGEVKIMRTSPNNHLFYGELVDATQNIPELKLKNVNTNVKTYTPTVDTFNNTFYIDDWGTVPTFNKLDGNFLTNKSNIKSIKKFKGLNTSSVTYMQQMFQYCSSLTSLDLSSWDISNVTTMTSMFNNCSSLTDVYITVEATLMKLTNNLSSSSGNYIPSNNGNCTIHYNGTDYKWQNNAWTPQS